MPLLKQPSEQEQAEINNALARKVEALFDGFNLDAISITVVQNGEIRQIVRTREHHHLRTLARHHIAV